MQKFQVAVLGLNSLFGQMSSLLLKQSRIVKRLALYDDNNIDAAQDISIINTSCKVEAFLGKEMLNDALKDADIVLIGDDPLSTPHTCFDLMAPKICDYGKAISSSSPNAIVIVAASPVNILVPLLSEVIMECGNYDSNKILGSTAVDNSRANCIFASHLNFSPQKVTLPVIGGASKETRIPLVSQAKPSLLLQKDLILKITEDIRNVDNYVFSLKKSPEALNKAYATLRFINIVFAGLKGEQDCVSIAFARTSHIPEVEYFSLPIRFGRFGIQKTYGLPAVSTFEEDLIETSIDSLRAEIEQAKLFFTSKEKTADLFIRKSIRSNNPGLSESISFKDSFVDSKNENLEESLDTNALDCLAKNKSHEIKSSKLDNELFFISSKDENVSSRDIIKEHSENQLSQVSSREKIIPFHQSASIKESSSNYKNVINNKCKSSDLMLSDQESRFDSNLNNADKSLPFKNIAAKSSLKVTSSKVYDSDHTTLDNMKNACSITIAKDELNDAKNSEFKKCLIIKNNSNESKILDKISFRHNLKDLNRDSLKPITDQIQSKLFQTTKGNLEKSLERNNTTTKLDPADIFYFKSNNLHTISELNKIDDGQVITNDGTGASKVGKHVKEAVMSKNQFILSTDNLNKNKNSEIVKRAIANYKHSTNTPSFVKSSLEDPKANKFSQLLKDKKIKDKFPIKLFKENYSKISKNIFRPTHSLDKNDSVDEKNEIMKAQNSIYDENIMTGFMREERKGFPLMCFSKKIFLKDLIKQVNEKAIEEEKTLKYLKSPKTKSVVNRQTNKLSELKVNKAPNENELIIFPETNKALNKIEYTSNATLSVKEAESDKTCLRKAIENMVLGFEPKKLHDKKNVVKVNINGPISNQPLYHDMINREKKSCIPVENELTDKQNFEQKHIFLLRPVAKEDEKSKLLMPDQCSKSNINEEKNNLIKYNFKPFSKLRQMTEPKETHIIKHFTHIDPIEVNGKDSFESKKSTKSIRNPHTSEKFLPKISKTSKLSLDSENDKSLYYLKRGKAIFKMLQQREKPVVDKCSQKEDTVDYLINNLYEEVNCETLPSLNRLRSNDKGHCELAKKEEKCISGRDTLDTKFSTDMKTIETPNESVINKKWNIEKKRHNTNITNSISLSSNPKPCTIEEDLQCDTKRQCNQRPTNVSNNIPLTKTTNVSNNIPYSKLQKREKKTLDGGLQPSMTIDRKRIISFKKCFVPEKKFKPQLLIRPTIKFEPKTTLNKFYLLVNKNVDNASNLPLSSRNIDGKRLKDTIVAQNSCANKKEMATNQTNELFKKTIVFSRIKSNQLQNFTLKKSHLPPVGQVEKQSGNNNPKVKNYSNLNKKSVEFFKPKTQNLRGSLCTEYKMSNMPLFSKDHKRKNTSQMNFCKNYQSPSIAFTHKTIYTDKKGTDYKNPENNISPKLSKMKLGTDGFLSSSKMTPRIVNDAINIKVRQMNSVAQFSTSSLQGRRKSPSRMITDIIKEKSKKHWSYPSSTKKNKYSNKIHDSPIKMLSKDSNKELIEPRISRTKEYKLVTTDHKSKKNLTYASYPYSDAQVNNKHSQKAVQNLLKKKSYTLSVNESDQKLTEYNTISSMKEKENIGSYCTYHKCNISIPKKYLLKADKYFSKNNFQAKPYSSLVTSIGESTSSYIFRQNVFKGGKFYHTNCEKRVSCFNNSHIQLLSPICEKFQDSQPIEKLYKPFTKGAAGLEYSKAPRLPPVNKLQDKNY